MIPLSDTLPSEYNMLLYFTPEEMELLCDTTLQSNSNFNNFVNVLLLHLIFKIKF